MYEGTPIGDLPERILLPWCRVRVPVSALPAGQTTCEGYLVPEPRYRQVCRWPDLGLGYEQVPTGEMDWYLTPEPPPRKKEFARYIIDITKCDPMKDIILVEYTGT